MKVNKMDKINPKNTMDIKNFAEVTDLCDRLFDKAKQDVYCIPGHVFYGKESIALSTSTELITQICG